MKNLQMTALPSVAVVLFPWRCMDLAKAWPSPLEIPHPIHSYIHTPNPLDHSREWVFYSKGGATQRMGSKGCMAVG